MGLFDKFRINLQENSEDVDAVLKKGMQLMQGHFYDRASVEFDKALSMDKEFASKEISEFYQQAQSSGDTSGMMSIGVNILKQAPDNPELANLLANSYRKRGNIKQAKNLYNHAIKYDPAAKNPAYNLAACTAGVDAYDGSAVSAIASFESLKTFKLPECKKENELLEKIKEQLKKQQEEEKARLLKEAEEKAEMYGDEEKKEEDEESEAAIDDAIKKAKRKAEIEVVEIETVSPEMILRHVLKHAKDFSEEELYSIHFGLSMHALEKNLSAVARKSLSWLVEKDPKNLDLRCFQILTLSLMGKPDQSIDRLLKLLGKYPHHRYSNVNLGYLYHKAGKTLKSRRLFFTAYRLLEHSQGFYSIDVCLDRAEKYYKDNHYRKALGVYVPLLKELQSMDLIIRTAELHVTLGELDKAYEVFKMVLRQDPKNETARDGIKDILEKYKKETDRAVKAKDWEKTADLLNKTIEIAPTKVLLTRAIDINKVLGNRNRVGELGRLLDRLENEDRTKKVQKKLKLAAQYEKDGDLRKAVRAYEDAIKIQPQRKYLRKMVDLCMKMEKPEMAEKLTGWYNEKFS